MAENTDPDIKFYISHTPREWKIIENRLSDMGRKNLSAYVRGAIKILEKQYESNPEMILNQVNINKKKQKPLKLSRGYFKTLGSISVKTGVPVSRLIDRFIIEPLMMPLD